MKNELFIKHYLVLRSSDAGRMLLPKLVLYQIIMESLTLAKGTFPVTLAGRIFPKGGTRSKIYKQALYLATVNTQRPTPAVSVLGVGILSHSPFHMTMQDSTVPHRHEVMLACG